jgi:hypothetical protein
MRALNGSSGMIDFILRPCDSKMDVDSRTFKLAKASCSSILVSIVEMSYAVELVCLWNFVSTIRSLFESDFGTASRTA